MQSRHRLPRCKNACFPRRALFHTLFYHEEERLLKACIACSDRFFLVYRVTRVTHDQIEDLANTLKDPVSALGECPKTFDLSTRGTSTFTSTLTAALHADPFRSIGVVFVFQNRLIRLFSWRNPTHTLSFLATYSFCCLDPSLLAVLPLAVCLFFIMVPAFIARHPPPPGATLAEAFSIRGPASAMPKGVKPAPEMSKDFFRNMRDLQNSMEDFSVIHDRLVAIVSPLTNFSDESLSSLVFLILFFTACLLFIFSSSFPWRELFLVGGWTIVGSLHPVVGSMITSLKHEELKAQSKSAGRQSWQWARSDIVLDEQPETREVEVFELQRHRPGSEWEPWLYTTLPYTPLSPRRIAGERPTGTRFFEDVQTPQGWQWKDKKWTLDLLSKEWVEERMITAVEIETEGERWVYDISAGDAGSPDDFYRQGRQDWEENATLSPKGDWRRRRWIRRVQRKTIEKRPA